MERSNSFDRRSSKLDRSIAIALATVVLCVSPAFADVPVAADLTNLTYTATGDLSATLVDPAPNSASRTIASKILVSTVAGAGVELKVDNRIISTKQIGLRTVNKKTGETRYEYFGVVLAEGPNVVELTPLGGAGSRGPTSRYTLYGPGRPAHFTFSLDRALRADGGNTISTLSIGASDRWNNPAMPGAIIKLNITAGDLHFLVASPAELGQPTHYHLASAVEMPIASGGLEQIQLSGGLLPGEVTLQLTAADTVTTERFYVEPNLRKPFVAGLVTVGAGPVPGFAGMPAAVPDGQQTREGRIAMFATGTVFNDVLATAAYDTANVLQQTLQGPYVTDPYDRPFQTYGDTSYLHDDALSTDHLYARFDRNQSSFMWGEFRPDTGSTDPDGAYHLLIDGAKLELGTDRTRVVAFTANNQFAYARQQFNPTGLSMSGQILHPDIVVGSDIVTLVALDSRTGAVLNQTIMVNNVDYTIDYSTGMLRFINIPLPYDDHFNPQVIQVQYEYGGVGVASETTGGRASVLLDSKGALQLNVGYVNDFSGVANFSLFEQSLQGTTHGGAWSIAHVESNGAPLGSLPTASQTGSEIHATFSQVSGTNRLAFEFETASADFDNPFGGFATPGLTSYNLDLKHLFNPDSDIAINFNLQHNISASGSENQSQASAIYHHVWKNGFTIKAGLQANDVSNVASSISGGTVTGSNLQSIVGFGYKFSPRLAFGVEDIANIGGGTLTPSEPSQALAQITYSMPNNTKFYVRDRWSSEATETFASSSAPFTTASEATQSLAIGFARDMSTATAVDAEWGVDHTNNGPDIYSAYGVREKFTLLKNLKGDAFLQDGNAVGGGMEGFVVYGLNASYSNTHNFASAVSWQNRTGSEPGSSLTAGFSGPLGQSFAVQGTIQDSWTPLAFDDQDRIGFAWRPSLNDRGATLVEWDHRIGSLTTLSEQTDVILFQQVYRPTQTLELAARYAYKMDGGAYYLPHTSLAGLRVDQRFGPRYDLGVETQIVEPAGIPAAKSTDFAVENGYRVGGAARLAVGYNFSGSADPTLTGAPVRRGAYVTMTSIVDHIFGWGR